MQVNISNWFIHVSYISITLTPTHIPQRITVQENQKSEITPQRAVELIKGNHVDSRFGLDVLKSGLLQCQHDCLFHGCVEPAGNEPTIRAEACFKKQDQERIYKAYYTSPPDKVEERSKTKAAS